MRRRSLLALLAPAVFLPAAGARAVSDLDGLVGELLAPRGPEGRVDIAARVEPDGDHLALVVELRPLGDAKLVADPGAVLRAGEVEGIAWLARETRAVEPGRGYFDGAITLTLPFRAFGSGEVRARLDYAWCLVGFQCLFGERELRIPLAGAPAG